MHAAYLFSVVLGGGLLLLSMLGDLLGSDAVEMEMDVDVDVELDVDGDVDGSASKILSIRTLTYTIFGFGAAGWLLSQLGFAPAAPATVAYAAATGLISGTLVSRAFGYLRRTETGQLGEEASLVGLLGQVTLPLGEGSAGQVAVERGGRRFTLRALPHSSARARPPDNWRTVVVVEMGDGIAYVAPADDELKALP